MSPESKSNTPDWKPSASIETLRARASIIKKIREFFYAREVLEVETPLLARTSVTDPYIESIPAILKTSTQEKQTFYYLQTSPEYAMKRLLAAGSGPIFQICKAFRQNEHGYIHNPEFTILEWYRLNYDHHLLMDEMDELLQSILKTEAATRVSYASLFEPLGLDPHQTTLEACAACAKANGLEVDADIQNIDDWLNLIMSHVIEPKLGQTHPCFVYDFPKSQAALARIQPVDPPLASRFEVYYRGTEIANGFHELLDAQEQRQRFEKNLIHRKNLGLFPMPIDELFISALQHGLPDCAGVALGVDRLVMLATQSASIHDVLSFDFRRA